VAFEAAPAGANHASLLILQGRLDDIQIKLESRISQIIMPSPLVSIVIPCWNGEAYLAEAIASAISQTHEAIEIIVVDDGSTDKSCEIARGFPGIEVLSQKNAGVSAARNAGLERAKGEFILFLDADDRLHSEAVRNHLAAFGKSDATMVYGSNRIVDAQGGVIGQNTQPTRSFTWKDVLMGVTPTPSQAMLRRDALTRAGSFNPSVALGEDFDLYLRVTHLSHGYCHGEVVADYRLHPQQATKQPSASLVSILGVIESFRSRSGVTDDEIWDRAHQHWATYYGRYIPFEIVKSLMKRDWRRNLTSVTCYARHLPYTLVGSLQYIGERLGTR
jgi:glycosyltransferase involved in cell wall biosynthesis